MHSAPVHPEAPRGRPLLRAPAVEALLIQVVSLLLAIAFARGIPALFDIRLGIPAGAVTQGAIAAVLSRLRGLASWWLPIQLLFPIALVATLSLRLPPELFLLAFIALLGLYWSTFRTQVPFYPSGPAVWEQVATLLPQERPVRFIDIGSGLGGLVLHLSGARRDSAFVGIELAPLPWLASVLRARWQRSGARFIRGDYGHLGFAGYDVVFAYLSPAAMPALWQKARAEMRAGSLLLSYEFIIPGVEPDLSCIPVEGGPTLFGWRM